MIIDETAQGSSLEIDFSGCVIASTSFFDEGFAKLANLGWTQEKFDGFITLSHMDKKDFILLDKIMANRMKKK